MRIRENNFFIFSCPFLGSFRNRFPSILSLVITIEKATKVENAAKKDHQKSWPILFLLLEPIGPQQDQIHVQRVKCKLPAFIEEQTTEVNFEMGISLKLRIFTKEVKYSLIASPELDIF